MKVLQNFNRYRFLLYELVKKNIKLKYRRSYLGMLWTLLEPILTTIVLTFVFGNLLSRSDDKTFAIYILIGRLEYTFFSTGTKMAMRSIRKNAGMIKKVYVPKYIYPLSGILSNFIIFLISLIVLVGALLVKRVMPTVYILQLIPILLTLLALTLGVGMMLASLSVFFKDLEYLWDVALMLIMYCCAIFYTVDPVKMPQLYKVIRLNPLYGIIDNSRMAVLGSTANPGARLADPSLMLYTIAFSILTVIIGVTIFRKKQDKFILYI